VVPYLVPLRLRFRLFCRYGRFKNREFLLFHETEVAPGRVHDIASRQNDEIKTIDYTPRTDLVEYMKDL